MRIINDLELKLGILHQLLVIQSARNVTSDIKFNKLLEGEFKDKTLRDNIEDLISINNDQSNDYIELLREIRDYLLGS